MAFFTIGVYFIEKYRYCEAFEKPDISCHPKKEGGLF